MARAESKTTRYGPVSHAIVRLARLHRTVAGQILRDLGLHPGQELLMMYLRDFGPLRQSDLVRLLDVDPSTLTRMVQRLEQGGFVQREPATDDRRVVVVTPTPAGAALLDRIADAWRELESATLDGLSGTDQRQVRRLLARMETNLYGRLENRYTDRDRSR